MQKIVTEKYKNYSGVGKQSEYVPLIPLQIILTLAIAFLFFLLLLTTKHNSMRDWLRSLIAGYAAYKWGGGCLGTIVVFAIIYWALGHC
jgi:uncharacterized membrane protein YdcZ (DUF606 family)